MLTAAEIAVLVGRLVARQLVGDRLPLLLGLGAGLLATVVAVFYGESVPKEFYAVCAQINPVFLVALVVEQRLADALGTTAQEWERNALAAWVEWTRVGTPPAYAGQEADQGMWRNRWADYTWVADTPVGTPVAAVAQEM